MSQYPRNSMSINSMLGTANDVPVKPPVVDVRPNSVPAQHSVPVPAALRRSPHMPTFRAASQPPIPTMHEPARFFQHPVHPAHQHETIYNHHQHLPHLPQHHNAPHHPIDTRLPVGLSHGSSIHHPQPGHFQVQPSVPPRDYRPPLLVDRDREREQREREKERELEQDHEREREQRVIREREEQRMRELQQRERNKLEQQQRMQQQQQHQVAQPQSYSQHSVKTQGALAAPQASSGKAHQSDKVRQKEPAARQRNRAPAQGEASKRADRSPPLQAQKAPRNDYTTTSIRSNSPAVAGSQTNNRRHLLLNALNNLSNDFAKQKDQYFNHQLRQLQEDLSRLHNGTHLQFNADISDLQDVRNETLFNAREEGLSRLVEADKDYEREVTAAQEEYEATKTTLRAELITYLESKKRKLEADPSLTDIALQSNLGTANGDAPPSPSLSGVPRKLRHRIHMPVVGSRYPSTSMVTKTALDGVLESIGDTVRARKGMGGAGAEDRVRDRIEREREKLVRTMLEGCRPHEADDDMALMRRKYVPKKSAPSSSGTVNGNAAAGAKRKVPPS